MHNKKKLESRGNLPLDFILWLKNKKNNDYWYLKDSPDDYALRLYNENIQLLKEKNISCKYLNWFVTNNCNLSCNHCGVSANDIKFKNLTLEEFANIIPDLRKIGTEYISLSGGEPFSRKDIFDIIAVLKICEFKVSAVTNGFNFKKNKKKLSEYPLNSIMISIDGLEETHNKIRGSKNSFQEAISAIEVSKEVGINVVNVHTCVYPENFGELEKLRELFFSKGINQWILRPVFPSGRAKDKNKYSLSNEQIKELLYFARDSVFQGFDIIMGDDIAYLGKLDSILSMKPFFFSGGWNSMVILPNGDIKGVEEDFLPVEGNILKDSIIDIWYNKFEYYRFPKIPSTCLNCNYYPNCHGGYLPGGEIDKRCIKQVLEIIDKDYE